MTIVHGNILGTDTGNIARAISAFADAARDDTALLVSSAIVGSDARITDAGENYTGTLRWLSYTDPKGAQVKPNETVTDVSTNLLTVDNQAETYIKNIDAVAAQEASIQSLISKVDGLSYLGRQFGATRARREDQNLRAVLRGVVDAIYTESNFPTITSADKGATVNKFGWRTSAYDTEDTTGFQLGFRELFVNSPSGNVGGARSDFFDELLNALTGVSGEFEESFYYLAISPATYNTLRKENVMDSGFVQDGNISFNTILGGKIRLLVTDLSTNHSGDHVRFDNRLNVTTLASGLNGVSVLLKPSAIAYQNIAINNPTAIDRNELAGNMGGAVTIISRWGNIMHPKGYTWAGASNAYPTDTTLAAHDAWDIVAENVNQTGIFPIFHG